MRVGLPAAASLGGRVAGGVCQVCGFVNATVDGVKVMACRGCGQRVRLQYVIGSTSEMPCDDRCQYATKDVCSCSCGGTNHRRGYIHVELVPVWVRERDTARHEERKRRAEERERRVRLSAEERARARRDELLARWPVLAELTVERYDVPGTREHLDGFLIEMFWAWRRGDMTDRQAAAAAKAIERERRFEQVKADRARLDAQRVAAGVRVPSGKLTFTGRIVSVRRDPNVHAWSGRDPLRGLVEHADGWRVWGTLPEKALQPPDVHSGATNAERDALLEQWRGWTDRLPGRVVTLVAEVKPSDDDQLFGFFKRARLVSVEPVNAPEVAPAPVEADAGVSVDAGVGEGAPADAWEAFLDLL